MSPRFRRSARRPHSSRGLGLPGLELLEDRTVPGVVSDSALPLLNDRASENAENFFVYKDQDSAFNHGNAYVLFPDASNIAIDTGCVNDPSSSTGCTTDPDRLDPVNGNILFVRFDPLTGT
ncbi:MAG TPA: hypothetical protein VIL46_16665, partial [Gemmataceae bacterium]